MKKFEKIKPKFSNDEKSDSFNFDEESNIDERQNSNMNDLTFNVKNLDIKKNTNTKWIKREDHKHDNSKAMVEHNGKKNGHDYDDMDTHDYNESSISNDRVKNDILRNNKYAKNNKNKKNGTKTDDVEKRKNDNDGKKFDDRRRRREERQQKSNKKSYQSNGNRRENDNGREKDVKGFDFYKNSKQSISYDSDDLSSIDSGKNYGSEKKLKTIDSDKDKKHSFSIRTVLDKTYKKPNTEENPLFPSESMIVGIYGNGRIRTINDFWCPKNLPVIELTLEVDIDGKIVSGPTGTDWRYTPTIYLIPNHKIRFHTSSKLVIQEKFIVNDTVEMTNIKIPYINKKDGTLRLKTTSKLNVKKVILTDYHFQQIDIFGPSIHAFFAKYGDGELKPALKTIDNDKGSYHYHVEVDRDIDLDDPNSEKCPYYIDITHHDISWDCDLDLDNLEDYSNLSIKHSYIYPSEGALKRLNILKD